MSIDFNQAAPQREGDLIPDGTIATVHLTLRPAPTGGWLKRSKSGESSGLDCEFTVVDGPFAKRKFWGLFTVEGKTEGHGKAGEVTLSTMRGVVESARGIRPDDESEEAKQGRLINDWGDIDGLRFIAKIGVEKGTNGYKDKNKLITAITPDKKAWVRVEQVHQAPLAPAAMPTAAVAAQAKTTNGASSRPAWAR